jgi:hypothetical protein
MNINLTPAEYYLTIVNFESTVINNLIFTQTLVSYVQDSQCDCRIYYNLLHKAFSTVSGKTI